MQRIARLIAPMLVLGVVLAACTGDDGGGENGGRETGPRTGATGETAPEPVGPTNASDTSATYEYANAGLRVLMDVEGTSGTMEIENGTDHEVGKPSFYILDALTGAESDGRVEAGAPIAAGETARFDVSLGETQIPDIGAVVLVLGKDNYGLFVRTA